jgi:DNA repair protein RecO (recombination protein O)
MRVEGERAFVLHARLWRETSLIVELLSESHGRIGAVARGVQGPKKHVQRAALQPWQCIAFAGEQRGELWTLKQWEAVDAAPRHTGEAALAGFYVNELMLRLLPRQDAVPEVFALHQALRQDLGVLLPLSWCLRRYERDLLEALGLGLAWGETGDGEPLDPAARYRVDPEQGLWRDRTHAADSVRGSALLALAADVCPLPEELAELRRIMRIVLAHHLGGKPLKAWTLMADMARSSNTLREASATLAGVPVSEHGVDPSK